MCSPARSRPSARVRPVLSAAPPLAVSSKMRCHPAGLRSSCWTSSAAGLPWRRRHNRCTPGGPPSSGSHISSESRSCENRVRERIMRTSSELLGDVAAGRRRCRRKRSFVRMQECRKFSLIGVSAMGGYSVPFSTEPASAASRVMPRDRYSPANKIRAAFPEYTASTKPWRSSLR
jgi:hypothetical protein